MSTVAIAIVAVCLLLAWCVLVDAMKAVAIAEAQADACPCRGITSLTVRPGASPLVASSTSDEAAIAALQSDVAALQAARAHSGTSH